MKLEDGIYEVEDLFYENCKFVVVAAQNDIEFAHDASPEMRLKLEVLHPDLDFSKPVKVQENVSSERCEFMKSALKSVLASSTDSKRMTKAIAGILDVFCGCSMFETSFFLTVLLASGLNYTVQKNGAPAAESVIMRKGSPRGINTIMAKTILACPAYIKFRHAMRLKAKHGDPADIKLHSALMNMPFNLKKYFWTKADAEESLAIVKANPFLSQYI